MAGAYLTVSTTAVTFAPIPAHTVLSGTSIWTGKAISPVVLGGATTVPTNATTVQMTVTVKGTKDGTLSIFPAGDPTGGSPASVSWSAGSSTTTTVAQNVGYKSKISFQNNSAATATVTVKLIGYSTQVTAGDISPAGGTTGQVLTNNGSEVIWQTPNFQSTDTRTITVHPGSNATTNGTALRSAVAGITPGTPTLVRLEPGTYDLGAAGLTLPDETWLAGAGQGLTTVSGSASPLISLPASNGLELLSVSGSSTNCVAVGSASAVTVQLVNVAGCTNGVQNIGAGSVSIADSTITSTNGHAVEVITGSVSVSNTTLTETGSVGSGVYVASGASATISGSSISGVVFSLLVYGAANIADTKLVPGIYNIGPVHCVGDYNGSYAPLSSACT